MIPIQNHTIQAISMPQITKKRLMSRIDWVMTADVEYLHSKSRSQHVTRGASLLSWDTDLHSIPRTSGGPQDRYRGTIAPHSGSVGLQVCYRCDGSLNEPFSKSHMNVQIKQLHSGYTQWDAIQLISEIFELPDWHLHTISSPVICKLTGIDNKHWYTSGLYTHFMLHDKNK